MYLKEIAKDGNFKPNMLDDTFKIQAGKGLTRFIQMFTNQGFETFENLSKKFNLPKTQFYKYLQVRNYIAKTMANNKTLKGEVREKDLRY